MIYEIKDLEWKDVGFTGRVKATAGFLEYSIVSEGKYYYLYTYALGIKISSYRFKYLEASKTKAEKEYLKLIKSCLKEPSEAALMRYVTSKDIPG